MRKTLFLMLGVMLILALAVGVVACGEEEESTTTAAPTTAPPTTAGPETTTTSAPETTTTEAAVYPEGKWKFTYNTFFPPTNNIAVVQEMWQAEITKRTNGAVKFEYLPGASLTKADKVFDGVVTGISDLGNSVFAYTVGTHPVMEFLDYPLGYNNGYGATMLVNEYFNEFKPPELDNVKVLMLYGTGPQVVFTTKKPVKTLADAKGLVLRSTGVGAAVAKALGAEGYAAPQNEAYELLSKGVIDGSVAPREVLLGWKQGEVVKYVTQAFSVGSITTMFLIMNKDKWESLPADIQQIFTDVSTEYLDAWGKVSAAYDYDAMQFFMGLGQGRETIELAPEESEKWKAAVQPIVSDYAKKLADGGHKGDYEGFITKKIEEWTTKAPSEADCSAWVKENVKSPSAK